MDRRKPSLPRQVRSSDDDDSSDEGPRTVTVARSGPVKTVPKPGPVKRGRLAGYSSEVRTGTKRKVPPVGRRSKKSARDSEGEDDNNDCPDSPPEFGGHSHVMEQIDVSDSEEETLVVKQPADTPEEPQNQGQSSASGMRKMKQPKEDRKRDQHQKALKPAHKAARKSVYKPDPKLARKPVWNPVQKLHQKSAQKLGSVTDTDQAPARQPEEIPEEQPAQMQEEQPAQMQEEQPAQMEEEQPAQTAADQPAQNPEGEPEEQSSPKRMKIPTGGKISRGPYSTLIATKKRGRLAGYSSEVRTETKRQVPPVGHGSKKSARDSEGEDDSNDCPDSPPEFEGHSHDVDQIDVSDSEEETQVPVDTPEEPQNQEGQSSASGMRKMKQPEEIPEEQPAQMQEEQPAQMEEEQPAQTAADQPAQIPEDEPEEQSSPKRMEESE